jgi:hypothetical protein
MAADLYTYSLNIVNVFAAKQQFLACAALFILR